MQKISARFSQSVINFFSLAPVKCFLRRSFFMGSLLSFSVYASLKLIFHDFPVELAEETMLILQLVFTSWCLAALCLGGFNGLMFIADYYTAKSAAKNSVIGGALLTNQTRKNIAPPEYDLMSGKETYAINKNGQLRYVIHTVKPAHRSKREALPAAVKNNNLQTIPL